MDKNQKSSSFFLGKLSLMTCVNNNFATGLDWIGLTSDYGVSTALKIVAGPLLSLLIPCLVEVNGPLRLALVADGFVPFLSKVFLAVKHF